jgi:hypothetical protein
MNPVRLVDTQAGACIGIKIGLQNSNEDIYSVCKRYSETVKLGEGEGGY